VEGKNQQKRKDAEVKRHIVLENVEGQLSNARSLPGAGKHPTERGMPPPVLNSIAATVCVIQGILIFLVYTLRTFTEWTGTVVYVNELLLPIVVVESMLGVPMGLVTLAVGTLYLQFYFLCMNSGYRVAFIASNILTIVAVCQVLPTWLPNNWRAAQQAHAASGKLIVVFILAAFPSLVAINAFMFWRRTVISQRLIALAILLAGTLLIADFAFALSYPPREFASRFLLKVIVVAAVSVGVLGYCGYILNRMRGAGVSIAELVGLSMAEGIAIALVVIVILFGPPSVIQLERLDRQRLNDLHTIEFDVMFYGQTTGKLPMSLDVVPRSQVSLDPVTRQPYEYLRTGDFSFEVCASFAMPGEGRHDSAEAIFGPEANKNWSHPAGRTCFKRTIYPNVLHRDDEAR